MSATKTQSTASAAVGDPQEEQPSDLRDFSELPQPVLEMILISGTNVNNKKALRQTCKVFQKILDNSLTCLVVSVDARSENQHLHTLMKREEFTRGLSSVIITARGDISLPLFPRNLTTLKIHADHIFLQELGKLPYLTTLELACDSGKIAGIEHVTGLTRLHVHKAVGSLAHLAPTLKHLKVALFPYVLDTNQLTNLQVLEVLESVPDSFFYPSWDLPHRFFSTHSQLPLQQLCLFSDERVDYFPGDWLEAPTTLTRLTLHKECKFPPERVLPTHITCLQVLHASSKTVTQAAKALPWLKRLELHLNFRDNLLSDLSQLTSLQTLVMCVTVQGSGVYWSREQVLSKIPKVARAVERGVELSVKSSVSEFLGVLNNPCRSRSSWSIRS